MKKTLTGLLIVLILFTMTACSKKESKDPVKEPANLLEKIQQRGYIIVGTSPDWAPYEFIDASKTGDDKYVGSDIELAKYIAEQLGVELKIKPMEFSAILTALASGEIDIAISGLGYTEERDEAIDFSITYHPSDESTGYHGLMVRMEDKDKYATLEDFEGLVIGAQNGSLQQGFVETQMKNVTIKLIGSLGDGVMMLQTKAIDALAITSDTGGQYALNNPDIFMTEIKFVTDTSGELVGIPEGEKELVDAINEIIEDVLAKGLYEQWLIEATELSESMGIGQ